MKVGFGTPLFLVKIKKLLADKKVLFKPRNRNKTLNFLLKHGLTSDDAFDVIEQLEEKHFYSGPNADRDGSEGNVMIFVYPHDDLDVELYIKLKFWIDPKSGEEGAVLSFHEEGMHND